MLARFFIDRPIFAWVIALVILLAGMLALRALPISLYPAVAPPAITFNITYPGASAKVIENTVTSLIEQEMNGIENLLYIESSAEQGSGSLTLTFQPGISIDIASVEAQNRFKRVEARLPDEVRRVGVPVTKMARNFLMLFYIRSPDKSHNSVDLGSYASATLMPGLRRVKGVGEVLLFGTEYAMRLWLHPEKLQAYNLSPGDVIKAVRAQNVELAIGELGQAPSAPGQQMNAIVVTRSRLATAEEFGNILVRTQPDGSALRVKDVARVELGAQDYSVSARLNGQPIVAIPIRLTPDGNAMEVAKAARAKMAEMAPYFPKGIAWDLAYDSTTFINISIQEVLKTLLAAMLLVFLVIYLFLENLRATLIPGIVVPVTLIGTLAGLYVFGYSINVLTLFAIVLAVGIVVDDAIVVVEAVERVMAEEGLAPREAARKAMDQIFNAIIGITLVLSAVFAPMMFFGGSVGVIYRQFAMTLLIAMGFSILMALTLTPALCATLLKRQTGAELLPTTGFFGVFNRIFDSTRASYQSAVRRMMPKPWRYLLLYAVIIGVTGWLFLHLPSSFLPEEDQGVFNAMVQLPPGATLDRTLEVVDQVEQYYKQLPEVASVLSVVGYSFMGRGQNGAIMFVRLKEWEDRRGAEHTATALVRRSNQFFFQIKQAMVFAINPPPIAELATTGGFDFRLQDRGGIGREKLLEARNLALGLASRNSVLAGVRPEGMEPAPQLLLDIDRRKAETLGVSIADLNETLQSTLGVAYINDFERQGRILRVMMQADASLRATPETILRLPVRNRAGSMVPLSELVTVRWIVGAPKLDRFNGLPAMKIGGAAAPGHTTGEAMQAMEEVSKGLPTGFGFEWAGTSFEEQRAGSQAPLLFALALLVAFLALAALYESWSIPFAVMLAVPLGMFGSALAVYLRGMPNDVYFNVGLIAIIGLSAKNAILIIEFARKLQDDGMGIFEATLEACRLRFRPILMTSIAFIAGVLPLVVSSGAGAESRHAIGTGVIGGMITATFLALFLVPVFFVVVRRIFPGHARQIHSEKSGDDRHE